MSFFKKLTAKLGSTIDKAKKPPGVGEVQLLETVTQMLENCEKDCQMRSDAAGANFRAFAEAQPSSLTSVLKDVAMAYTDVMTEKRVWGEGHLEMKSGVQDIKVLTDGMGEKRKELDRTRKAAVKAGKEAEAASTKFERQQLKNPAAPDCLKFKADMEVKQARREQADSQLESFEAQFKLDDLDYKKKISYAVSLLMKDWASKRRQNVDRIVQLGTELESIATSFAEYEDPGLEKLKEELAELREKPAEAE